MELENKLSEAGPDASALAQLNLEIAQCHVCAEQGYVAISRPIDRGRGLKQIWLVGQAPGYGEGKRPVAFGGPAGRTLMGWFASLGLPEEKVREYFYMSAITKCYPGRAPNGGGDRNPTPIERTNCRPFLLRELVLVRPRRIILVGAMAIKELYGDKIKLDQIIGQKREMTLGEVYQRFSQRLIKTARATTIPQPPSTFNKEALVTIFHLPHPSGASTWLNYPENQALLEKALQDLKQHLSEF